MIYLARHQEWADLQDSRDLLEYTNDLISLLDLDCGGYVYASQSHQRVLGYDSALLVGKPITLLIHHEDQEIVQQQLASLAHQAEAQATVRYSHADGSWRWIEMRWRRSQLHSDTYVLVV